MSKAWKNLVRREEGASLVEYTLLLVLIAVVAITAVGTLGNTVSTQMGNVKNAIDWEAFLVSWWWDIGRFFCKGWVVMRVWKSLVRGEEGASLVEYTLLLVLIAVVAITAVGTLGNTVSSQMGNVKNAIDWDVGFTTRVFGLLRCCLQCPLAIRLSWGDEKAIWIAGGGA
jgi:pilus assembly protein Flp/PilA